MIEAKGIDINGSSEWKAENSSKWIW
jgi:hypothetical protein